MSWVQADWLTTPTNITNFFSLQEWEMGSIVNSLNVTGLPLIDSLLVSLIGSTTALSLFELHLPANHSITSVKAAFKSDLIVNTNFYGHKFSKLNPKATTDVLALGLLNISNSINNTVAFVVPASFYQTVISYTPTWYHLVVSLDPVIIAAELFFVAAFFLSADKFIFGTSSRQLFYDDLVTLCKYNNLSLTEIAVALTLSVGFIFFDIFVSFSEDDVIDALNYLILIFVILTFVFLLLAVDIQYFFMVSNAGGELTFRIIIFDLVNNVLCALRVFFCWIRYIFYDLQVELVDLSFHYTDAVNELTPVSIFDTNTANSLSYKNTNSIFSSGFISVWSVAIVFLDIALYLFQALAGLFKLVIASFLLWLIVDLFLLRGFALDESSNLSKLRAKK